jgi:uncharacterized protein YidB (DUF937 family)
MGLFDSGSRNRNGLSPAAIALLGLLAVKGFQNRDKLADMVSGALGKGGAGAAGQGGDGAGGLGGLLGGLGGLLGGSTSTGSVLSGGLGNVLDRFEQAGHGQVAQSWVKDGPNEQPEPQQVEQAVGTDVIDQLARETGLTREELLRRLTQELPKAVDQLTPQGHVPTAEEADAMIGRQQA